MVERKYSTHCDIEKKKKIKEIGLKRTLELHQVYNFHLLTLFAYIDIPVSILNAIVRSFALIFILIVISENERTKSSLIDLINNLSPVHLHNFHSC